MARRHISTNRPDTLTQTFFTRNFSLAVRRRTIHSATSFVPHFKLRHHPRPKPLDTACTIKEEPNSAQQPALSLPNGSCPALLDWTWSLSHLLAAGWGNEQMHLYQFDNKHRVMTPYS